MKVNMTPKEVYDFLNKDDDIFKIYREIENKENEDGGYAFHNYKHVQNVSKIAEKILTDLNFDENTIYECKIACLLHDVGALLGKEGHAQRSYEYSKKLFKDNNIVFEGSEIVLNAIKNHSSYFESDNIIVLSIILADKLDITKTRITQAGKKIKGNRQYQHIEDIIINIENQKMILNFITDGNIDIKEVNEYYFTSKVFKAIEAFSKKMNLKYDILMDNKNWTLDR